MIANHQESCGVCHSSSHTSDNCPNYSKECSLCGEPRPSSVHHIWACCGDGPGLAGVIKPESLDCAKRQLAKAKSELTEAQWKVRELKAELNRALSDAVVLIRWAAPGHLTSHKSIHVSGAAHRLSDMALASGVSLLPAAQPDATEATHPNAVDCKVCEAALKAADERATSLEGAYNHAREQLMALGEAFGLPEGFTWVDVKKKGLELAQANPKLAESEERYDREKLAWAGKAGERVRQIAELTDKLKAAEAELDGLHRWAQQQDETAIANEQSEKYSDRKAFHRGGSYAFETTAVQINGAIRRLRDAVSQQPATPQPAEAKRCKQCNDVLGDMSVTGCMSCAYSRKPDTAEAFAKAAGLYTPKPGECICWKCLNGKNYAGMVLCPTCGNKRCPKASDHDLACTGSNEPGQPGSVCTKQLANDVELREVRRLADDALVAIYERGASTAPIVRWFRWQEDRGLHVTLELFQRLDALSGVSATGELQRKKLP